MTKRVAVVTGTSRGIGQSIAKLLAERGLDVIATSRSNTDETKLDVSDDASVKAFASWLKKEKGGLDVLVNNAGVALDGFDAKVARRTVEVNFFGAVRATDALLPLMRPNGRIVMVSSGMGELSSFGKEIREAFLAPDLSRDALTAMVNRFVLEVSEGTHAQSGWPSNAYRVSKAAMNAFVRILARELTGDPRHIKVNAACPGWVRTKMGGSTAPLTPDEGARTPVWLATLPDDGPMGGFFRAERAIPW